MAIELYAVADNSDITLYPIFVKVDQLFLGQLVQAILGSYSLAIGMRRLASDRPISRQQVIR